MTPPILPDLFIRELRSLGLDSLIDTIGESKPEISLRLNPAKGISAGMLPFPTDGTVPWCASGYYLPERPFFTADPLLHQGGYYVQEASSMFHNFIISFICSQVSGPVRLLDACAAPGGKTTAAIEALPEGSLVVANEIIPSRAAVLRENIIKWSYPSCIVTRSDTASYSLLKHTFDIIMADVPCSGEGMMRKEPEAVAQWSPSLVEECAARQWQIVENLWPALRPGGYFIYSTCTFNRHENEEMVERIIDTYGAESISLPVDPAWSISPGIDTNASCYRFIPGRIRGEGLFVALLRKPDELSGTASSRHKKKCSRSSSVSSELINRASEFISEPMLDLYSVYTASDRIMAFPETLIPVLDLISRHCDVIHEGVTLATVKGRYLIPSHSLALSPLRDSGVFPEITLDRQEAIAYLSGEAPQFTTDTPTGYVIPTFAALPLGFAKNLGRRANNLYPAPWRIRMKSGASNS